MTQCDETKLFRPLTPQQQRVAVELAKGLDPKEIAELLGISNGTVRNYISTISERLPGDGKPITKVRRWALGLPERDSA